MKHRIALFIAVAAVMASAAPASATFTSPSGTTFNGTFEASSTNWSMDGSVKVSCTDTYIKAHFPNGARTGVITHLTTSNCHNDTVTVVNKGDIYLHSNGEVTWTGVRLDVIIHRVVFFPITTHCIYEANNTPMGTLTEGVAPAQIHLGSSPIPEVETDSLCGNDAVWTGTYTVTTPKTAIVLD